MERATSSSNILARDSWPFVANLNGCQTCDQQMLTWWRLFIGVSSSVAGAAAARLAALQAESIAHTSRQTLEENGPIGNSTSGASMDCGSDEGPAMPVGTGSRAGADYETAGEVLGANKKEFQDASGHPEPLYVGG